MNVRKQVMSATLPECKIAFLNRLAVRNKISRAAALEMLLDLIDLYFTEEQLDIEASAYASTDGRRKGD